VIHALNDEGKDTPRQFIRALRQLPKRRSVRSRAIV